MTTRLPVLRTKADWHEWRWRFEFEVYQLDLEGVILNGEPPVPVPIRPDPKAYANRRQGRRPDAQRQRPEVPESPQATRAETTGRSSTSESTQTRQCLHVSLPIKDPQIEEPGEEASEHSPITLHPLFDADGTLGLTDNEVRGFNSIFCLYEDEMSIYNLQRKALEDLRIFVADTLSPPLWKTYCNPKESIAEWYLKLKQNVRPDAYDVRVELHRQYREVLRKAPRKAEGVMEWLDQWGEVMMLILMRENSRPKEASEWFEDLMEVMSVHSDGWCKVMREFFGAKCRDNSLHYRDMARQMRFRFALEARGKRARGGVFGPAFGDQGVGDENEEEDETPKKKTKRTPKKKPQKGEGKGRSSLCKACERPGHDWEECWILRPEISSVPGFRVSPNRQKAARARIAKDPKLNDRLEKLLRKV